MWPNWEKLDALATAMQHALHEASEESRTSQASTSTANGEGLAAPLRCPFTEDERDESWRYCAETLARHDKDIVERWIQEIDVSLVFAGLFSAALTAFNVESYKLLQPDNDDTIFLALEQISSQLRSFMLNPSFANSTHPAFTRPSAASSRHPSYAVALNALWFSSLVCTLSASSVAVLVRQWLHQHLQHLAGTSKETARVRQYRHESIRKWKVPEILAVLPVLLQFALLPFLVGLLILLWNLNKSVAALATAFLLILVAFTSITTILPSMFTDCPYQSPQALSILIILQYLKPIIKQATGRFKNTQPASQPTVSTSTYHDWHSRDKDAVSLMKHRLDRELTKTAAGLTFEDSLLERHLSRCLWDMDGSDVIPYCREVVYALKLGDSEQQHGFILHIILRVFVASFSIPQVKDQERYQILRDCIHLQTLQSPYKWLPVDYSNLLWCLAVLAKRMGGSSMAYRELRGQIRYLVRGDIPLKGTVYNADTSNQVISAMRVAGHISLDDLVDIGGLEVLPKLSQDRFVGELWSRTFREVEAGQGDCHKVFVNSFQRLINSLEFVLRHPRNLWCHLEVDWRGDQEEWQKTLPQDLGSVLNDILGLYTDTRSMSAERLASLSPLPAVFRITVDFLQTRLQDGVIKELPHGWLAYFDRQVLQFADVVSAQDIWAVPHEPRSITEVHGLRRTTSWHGFGKHESDGRSKNLGNTPREPEGATIPAFTSQMTQILGTLDLKLSYDAQACSPMTQELAVRGRPTHVTKGRRDQGMTNVQAAPSSGPGVVPIPPFKPREARQVLSDSNTQASTPGTSTPSRAPLGSRWPTRGSPSQTPHTNSVRGAGRVDGSRSNTPAPTSTLPSSPTTGGDEHAGTNPGRSRPRRYHSSVVRPPECWLAIMRTLYAVDARSRSMKQFVPKHRKVDPHTTTTSSWTFPSFPHGFPGLRLYVLSALVLHMPCVHLFDSESLPLRKPRRCISSHFHAMCTIIKSVSEVPIAASRVEIIQLTLES